MNMFILTTLLAASASASADNMTAYNLRKTEVQKILSEKTANENRSGITVVTVGSSNDCDFRLGTTKIQDAIDSGADEVRVAFGTYNENILINDIDLVLKGGYATCADAVADNQTVGSIDTIIDAASTGAAIRVFGDDQRNTVSLDQIQVTGGTTGNLNLVGGGVTAYRADVALNLSNMWITTNTNHSGGGLSILQGDTDIVAYNLMVVSNSADFGGGIYCDGNSGTNSVFIIGDSDNLYGIAANQATNGNGGGVFLENGCEFTNFTGGLSGEFFNFRGITANSATEHGGGLYASSGSTANLIGHQECAFIFCFGYDTQSVNVTNNTADSDNSSGGDGGGIYATGTGTEVNVYNGLIASNTAYNGAGVTVAEGAAFFTNSTFKKGIDCWSPGSCNQIANNSTTGGFNPLGGAVYVELGGKAQVHRTHVKGNRANYGTAFYVIGPNSTLASEGSLFTGNGDGGADGFDDNDVVRAGDTATLILTFATLADNNISLTNGALSNGIIHNTSSTTEILSSIIHETNGALVYSSGGSPDAIFNCLVVHENLSFPGPVAIADDPDFIDRANGDYHINWATSPAVDLCDSASILPVYTDIDNQQRGWDWPGISNNLGPYDVGFDEQNDVIFADGFEDPS